MSRAIVIGSVLDGIVGVENDVLDVTAMLQTRGFAVRAYEGRAASRACILGAFAELLDQVDVGSDEPIVIYYAGHGGLVINKQPTDEDILPRVFQCLVPTDWEQNTDDDFHGISAFELSLLLHQLTDRSKNVSVILDCCYAGQFIDPQGAVKRRPRSLAAPSPLAIARHMEELKQRYGNSLERLPPNNPDVVSVVACSAQGPAWPLTDDQGRDHGALTLALVQALDDVGTERVPWASIITAVRRRIRDRLQDQRPAVEGPAQRLAFSLDTVDAEPIEISQTGVSFRLRAGTLAGVAPGDVYAASQLARPDIEVARVRVKTATPIMAEAALVAWGDGVTALPDDSIAEVREHALARKSVWIRAAPPHAEAEIVRAVDHTRRLHAELTYDPYVIATIELADDQLTLSDELGPLLGARVFPADLAEVLAVASNLAASRQLLDLEGEHGITLQHLPTEWGLAENATPWGTDDGIPAMDADQRIFVRMRNAGNTKLYVHVFNLAPAGSIVSLTSTAPDGIDLPSAQELVLGRTPAGDLLGIPLAWPSELPTDAPRGGCVLVIATRQPIDLRVLETVHPIAQRHAERSGLQALFSQVYTGALRRAREPVDGYLMLPLPYVLRAPARSD